MLQIFYRGSKYNVCIEDIDKIEPVQLQKIRNDIIEGFADFCLSQGAVIELFDSSKEMNTLIVSPNLQAGIYLQYLENSGDPKNHISYLSLYDDSQLDETIETFDEIYASKGLFLPIETAWSAIYDFITTGKRSSNITWITPNDIPEGGNW